MSLSLITAIILIFLVLIMIPLLISKKAERDSKALNEWDKIKEYGNNINKKTHKKY